MAGPSAGKAATRQLAATGPDRLRVSAASVEETLAIGARLGRVAAPGDLLCLWGELGAGKTQLAKGIARGLGVADTVNSPTFVLMSEYAGRIPLFHVDLYRLADAGDALAGGVVDDRQGSGVTVVEWPDRMRDVLPSARLDIVIEGTGDEIRSMDLVTVDPRYRRYLEAVR
jgi:tRNA threonylcarbamoyladenosine biosynthesis protein TsaE